MLCIWKSHCSGHFKHKVGTDNTKEAMLFYVSVYLVLFVCGGGRRGGGGGGGGLRYMYRNNFLFVGWLGRTADSLSPTPLDPALSLFHKCSCYKCLDYPEQNIFTSNSECRITMSVLHLRFLPLFFFFFFFFFFFLIHPKSTHKTFLTPIWPLIIMYCVRW